MDVDHPGVVDPLDHPRRHVTARSLEDHLGERESHGGRVRAVDEPVDGGGARTDRTRGREQPAPHRVIVGGLDLPDHQRAGCGDQSPDAGAPGGGIGGKGDPTGLDFDHRDLAWGTGQEQLRGDRARQRPRRDPQGADDRRDGDEGSPRQPVTGSLGDHGHRDGIGDSGSPRDDP
ncbi:MAG TPA: hypothetical protein DCY40_08065 [Actinobacteria bacterium]|nr:hypothetical protein [Actinomycetota bacterium]